MSDFKSQISNLTFHQNPKRKRGRLLRPSLALRAWIHLAREQYNLIFVRGKRFEEQHSAFHSRQQSDAGPRHQHNHSIAGYGSRRNRHRQVKRYPANRTTRSDATSPAIRTRVRFMSAATLAVASRGSVYRPQGQVSMPLGASRGCNLHFVRVVYDPFRRRRYSARRLRRVNCGRHPRYVSSPVPAASGGGRGR